MKTAKESTTSSLGEPINIFAPGCAARIMPDGCSTGGVLEVVEPVGDCLVRVVVSGWECLVDDSLQEKLISLLGQRMTICHVLGRWGCGPMPWGNAMNDHLLGYRQALCEALGGLDSLEERLMARLLILKIDAKERLR